MKIYLCSNTYPKLSPIMHTWLAEVNSTVESCNRLTYKFGWNSCNVRHRPTELCFKKLWPHPYGNCNEWYCLPNYSKPVKWLFSNLRDVKKEETIFENENHVLIITPIITLLKQSHYWIMRRVIPTANNRARVPKLADCKLQVKCCANIENSL